MRAVRLRHRGQAAVEHLIVAVLVALALGLAADGTIGRLVAAFAEHYRRFTFAISLP
jgi:Flp pilus assembly pilin Flp